jgi:hypothetical protein
MLTIQRFELTKSALGLDTTAGERGWITIPAGALVMVVARSGKSGRRVINVRWEGRSLAMFANELAAKGIEIEEKSEVA